MIFYKKRLFILLICTLTCLMVGCSHVPESKTEQALSLPPNPSPAHRTKTAKKQWGLLGKIAIQKGEKGDSARFDWQVAQEDFVLHLAGPWGTEGITLRSTLEGVTLTDQAGKTYHDGSVEALSQNALGWPIPWEALKYWVQGLPAPQKSGEQPAQIFKNLEGQNLCILQRGWKIEYLHYFPNQVEPKKMTAYRLNTRSHQENLKIKIWIERWDP